MRILLVGEYSRLHNSLKEGLVALDHEVTIVGDGDEFKKYPVDLNIDAKFFKSKIPNLFRQFIFRLTSADIAKIEIAYRFKKLLPHLKGYDVVQLISETPLQLSLSHEYELMEILKKQNSKLFILSSGADVPFVTALRDGVYRYSMLDPYRENKKLLPEFRHMLNYLDKPHLMHHEKMYALCDGVIASDMDYALAFHENPQFLGLIPNPVNTKSIEFSELSAEAKIVIFLGINRGNYYKKGIPFFEQALEIIAQKYGDRVKITTAENLAYDHYINVYNEAHILLDQVFAYDQGYNALEAMAKGKEVFTGAETEFMEHYNLTERVAINALPDVDAIVSDLSFLIENPDEIIAISHRARAFVEREHDYIKIANAYLDFWNT